MTVKERSDYYLSKSKLAANFKGLLFYCKMALQEEKKEKDNKNVSLIHLMKTSKKKLINNSKKNESSEKWFTKENVKRINFF